MDPAALPLSGFLPLYILVRAFLISRTQLSRSLEQTKASGIERVGPICHISQEFMTTLYSWASVSVCKMSYTQKDFTAVENSIATHI